MHHSSNPQHPRGLPNLDLAKHQDTVSMIVLLLWSSGFLLDHARAWLHSSISEGSQCCSPHEAQDSSCLFSLECPRWIMSVYYGLLLFCYTRVQTRLSICCFSTTISSWCAFDSYLDRSNLGINLRSIHNLRAQDISHTTIEAFKFLKASISN